MASTGNELSGATSGNPTQRTESTELHKENSLVRRQALEIPERQNYIHAGTRFFNPKLPSLTSVSSVLHVGFPAIPKPITAFKTSILNVSLHSKPFPPCKVKA